MHPLVGLNLGGATLTPFDDCVAGSGALGKPVWGPEQLLRDLELRLGLPSPQVNDAVRTARWAQRMSTIAAKRRFYTGSFDVDPLGTAASVLALRDALIEAGWDGTRIEAGGARLDAIAELEALTVSAAPALPAGLADRLVAVVRSLDARDTKLYDALTLAEPLDRWPLCWQRILGALEHNGTRLSLLSVELPCAAPDSDLGKVQAALFASTPTAGGSLLGDGTFLLVTAETSLEAARAAAALLAQTEPTQSVVIRERDAASLEHALFGQGLPSQGLHSSSPWRAALQVLPLALELAFEPKDPYRVLELLSLPNGPFTGGVGRRMVRALSRSPGIGSQAWEEAKERIPEPRQEALQRITEWFETTGSPPSGAAVSELLKVVERVRRWLVSRVAGSPEDSTLHVAVHQCEALVEALVAQPGDLLDLVHVRRLSESVTNTGASLELVPEHVGRISHVSTAQALWSPRATVLWWPFVQHYERTSPQALRTLPGIADACGAVASP